MNGYYNGDYSGYGTVISNNNGNIIVEFTTTVPYDSLMFNAVQEYEAEIYVYDTQLDEVRLGSINDILDEKTVGTEKASKMFFRIDDYNLQEIIVFR